MELSKDGSPVFIRVIRVIRGLFTVYFELHTACRDFRVDRPKAVPPPAAESKYPSGLNRK